MSSLASLLKDLRSALSRPKHAPPVQRPSTPVARREPACAAAPVPVPVPVPVPGTGPLDLGRLVRCLVAERHAHGQRVRLLVDAGGRAGVPTHRVPEQVLAMRQEIDQLVDHALQQGGAVELVVREDAAGVRVSVSERRPDGTGLRAELQYPRAA